MRKLLLVSALILTPSLTFAQDAKTYLDAVRECGAKWRESAERKATPKGEGQKAWNTFRATCVKEVGYVTKRSASKAN